MRMLKPGDRLGLGDKAGHFFGTGMSAGQDHLEGAGPVQPDMAQPVDHAHAAAAELARDLVSRNRGRGASHAVLCSQPSRRS